MELKLSSADLFYGSSVYSQTEQIRNFYSHLVNPTINNQSDFDALVASVEKVMKKLSGGFTVKADTSGRTEFDFLISGDGFSVHYKVWSDLNNARFGIKEV